MFQLFQSNLSGCKYMVKLIDYLNIYIKDKKKKIYKACQGPFETTRILADMYCMSEYLLSYGSEKSLI